MIKNLRLRFSIMFAALFTFTASIKAAIPTAENLLPENTLFVITAPDFSGLRTAVHQSSQWLLWNDPAMKSFHDKFMDKWNDAFVAPLEKDLGMKLSDFSSLPQGQLTFAITQNGWSGTSDQLPGIVLLLDAKDKSALLKTNLAGLQKKWTDAGKSIRTETIRDVKFSIVPLSSNDVPASLSSIFPQRQPVAELGKEAPPIKPAEIVIGQFESLLIVGNTIQAVEPVVTHLTGGSAPALNDNAFFAADKLAQFRDSPLYYGWFNARTFFTVLSHIPQPEPNPDAPGPIPQMPWDKALTASGAMGLKTASFSYRETREGSQVSFFLAAPEADRIGLVKMIAAAPKDANPPSFVPADAVKFWRWRVDGQKNWAALETMVGSISPAALSSLNFAISMAQQKDPNFDLRKNLIGNLGDDFLGYEKVPTGNSITELNSAPSIFLFGSANPEQAILAVKTFAALILGQQSDKEPRDFMGKKIYAIGMPAPHGPGATAPARSLYLTSSSGYVAISADSSIVENFLRNTATPPKPLRETAGLTDAAQHIGGAGSGLFAYENQREIMRFTFAALKNQSDSGVMPGSLSALPKNFRDWLDFSLLPDYDQVSKYFYFSVFGGNTTSEGISFKAFAPRPPQVN